MTTMFGLPTTALELGVALAEFLVLIAAVIMLRVLRRKDRAPAALADQRADESAEAEGPRAA